MTAPFLVLPAIPVSQPIGEFFLCSITSGDLLDVAYSIPATMTRESGMFSNIFGNQREKRIVRAKQIGAYVDEEESTFPNTIILSANYDVEGRYVEDENLRWKIVQGNDGCYSLIVPTKSRLASIIDGQHRLEGFKYAHKSDRAKMQLPCAVYINLPREYQARIFATININQKRVDKSLAYQLFGYDLNEENSDRWPPDMLGVYFARVLEGRADSPFKGHVKLALLEANEGFDNDKGDYTTWQVSVACLVEGITKLISEKPVADRSLLAQGSIKDRSQLPVDASPLRNLYIEGKDKTLLELIRLYFVAVNNALWSNQPENSFITRTVGVLALFDILREALRAGRIARDDFERSSTLFLQPAAGADFSDVYFHASGAGRVRIRNVLRALLGLGDVSDSSVLEVAERIKA